MSVPRFVLNQGPIILLNIETPKVSFVEIMWVCSAVVGADTASQSLITKLATPLRSDQ